MRLTALLLAFVALQDRPKDAVPVPPVIDSWYEITQDKEHAGWFHEQVSQATSKVVKYDYLAEWEGKKVTARLGASFEILSGDNAPEVRPNLKFYAMRQRGDLEKTVDREVLGKSAKVTAVTIADSKFTNYWVDRYGRIVEAQSADGTLIMKLVTDSATAKQETKGAVAPKGRRDPFEKPLTPPGAEPVGGTTGPKPIALPDVPNDFNVAIKEANDLVALLRKQTAEGKDDAAAETYQKILYYYERLYPETADPLHRPLVLNIRQSAEKYFSGTLKLVVYGRKILEHANDLAEGNCVDGIDEDIKTLREIRERREFFHPVDYSADSIDLFIEKAQEKRVQCINRNDLARMILVLGGVAYEKAEILDDVKFDLSIIGSHIPITAPVRAYRQSSLAIVNSESYREGDVIPGLGVRVEKISRSWIEVSYKGERREVGLAK